MQDLIKQEKNASSELLEGLVLAHQDIITLAEPDIVISKGLAEADRVTVIAFGGTGSEPAMSGFVGEGLLDAFVAGDTFAAPGPAACLKAVQLADRGHGVLVLYANHTGAQLTAHILKQQAQKLGLAVALVAAHDDAAQAGREQPAERRGLLGCLPLCKLAAAAAAAGKGLNEVAELAQRVADNSSTLVMAASENKAAWSLGAGAHGEAGGEELAPLTAAEAAQLLADRLLADLKVQAGEKLLLIVSGSGELVLGQQLIVFRSLYAQLEAEGAVVAASRVGSFLTLPQAAGLAVCLVRLDEELVALWQAGCNAPYYKQC